MAKQSMLARNNKRKKLVSKHRIKRLELKKLIKSSTDYDVIAEAQIKLAKLPKNSNSIRCNKICLQCGRPHGVYRKFGLCRICLRQQLMTGNVTGGRKSSW